MAATAAVVFPVFGIILIGWLARRVALIREDALRGLRDVVFFLAMPALLFSSMVQAPPIDFVAVAVVYFAACLVIFGLAFALGRLITLPLSRAAMLGLNSAYGNTVMVGIPVVVAALGADALPSLLAIIALHSAVLLSLAGVLMEAGSTGRARRSPVAAAASVVAGAVRNPVIAAIIIAFLWRWIGIPVPAPLLDLLRLLGTAATPLALVCLGASLPPLERRALGAETLIALALKLVALPALVWGLGLWAGLPRLPLAVAVITAAMPTGANAFLLAHRNDDLVTISAGTVLASTMLSVATLSILVALLD